MAQWNNTELEIVTIIVDTLVMGGNNLMIAEPDVKRDSDLQALGVDSEDRAEILERIELQFGVSPDEDDYEACLTVGELVEYVKNLM